MTKVKICGITTMEDAQHASACGAEMLGFNFYQKSRRYIAPEAARKIVASLPQRVESVGVFVNESVDEVRRIAEIAGVKSVQLHGDEASACCVALEDMRPIKAIRIKNAGDLEQVASFADCRILLDSASETFGGSGVAFDWELVRNIRHRVKELILAGGLGVENVERAIATVAPDAVDACSRLESSPGVKDAESVAQFIARAHGIQGSARYADGKRVRR